MATRRNVTQNDPSIYLSEKTISQSQGGPAGSNVVSDIRPAVESSVIAKLLFFTLAMVVVPLGSYFATLHIVFRGSTSLAGGFAAFMANVVLVGYIIVAMKEDQGDQRATAPGVNSIQAKAQGKKSQ